MSAGERRLDKAATKAARELHGLGQKALDKVFGWTPAAAIEIRKSRRAAIPSAERASRRADGKRQRLARATRQRVARERGRS